MLSLKLNHELFQNPPEFSSWFLPPQGVLSIQKAFIMSTIDFNLCLDRVDTEAH